MDKMRLLRQPDRLMMTLCLMYVFLPIYIFAVGWLNIYVAFCSIIILSVCFRSFLLKIFQGMQEGWLKLDIFDIKYWLIAGCTIMFWVYISGIGGFSYQTADFAGRNSIFRDLCHEEWPVCYDLSRQSEMVQSITGRGKVVLVYYFSYWLPVAFLSKIFGLSELGSNIALYIWSCLGILMILYLINRYHGKNTYGVLWLLICFSGLDVVGFFIRFGYIPIKEHMEWWGRYFQYSSNTTQLFWVFNQSIPTWIICALLLQFEKKREGAGLSAMVFAYSPWATIGMVPIALSALNIKGEKLKENIKGFLSFENVALPVLLLAIYGTFYSLNSNNVAGTGFLFGLNIGNESRIILYILLFWLLEFGIYYFIMGKEQTRSPFYYVVLTELICFPFYHISSANDFVMRGAIPALFFTMIYVGEFISKSGCGRVFRRRAIIVALCLGMWTPITEINRNISNTLNNEVYIYDPVHSLGMIETSDEGLINIVKNNFFAYDYKETFFFRWIAK